MLRSISGIARSSAAPALLWMSAQAGAPKSVITPPMSTIPRRSVRLRRGLNATLDLLRIDDVEPSENLPIRGRAAHLAALTRTLAVLDGIQVRPMDAVRRILRRIQHQRSHHALRRRIRP